MHTIKDFTWNKIQHLSKELTNLTNKGFLVKSIEVVSIPPQTIKKSVDSCIYIDECKYPLGTVTAEIQKGEIKEHQSSSTTDDSDEIKDHIKFSCVSFDVLDEVTTENEDLKNEVLHWKSRYNESAEELAQLEQGLLRNSMDSKKLKEEDKLDKLSFLESFKTLEKEKMELERQKLESENKVFLLCNENETLKLEYINELEEKESEIKKITIENIKLKNKCESLENELNNQKEESRLRFSELKKNNKQLKKEVRSLSEIIEKEKEESMAIIDFECQKNKELKKMLCEKDIEINRLKTKIHFQEKE